MQLIEVPCVGGVRLRAHNVQAAAAAAAAGIIVARVQGREIVGSIGDALQGCLVFAVVAVVVARVAASGPYRLAEKESFHQDSIFCVRTPPPPPQVNTPDRPE